MDIWAISEEQVYEELGTSPKGLTEDEAFARVQKHGRNVLPAKVGRPIIFKFLDQFTSLFAIMLEVGALCTFIAAMLSSGASRQDNINVTIAILGVVILNGVIGFFQEYRAEKATEALQKLRGKLRDHTRAATALGFGPRFLHSTGQAYKGGPNSGVFIEITHDASGRPHATVGTQHFEVSISHDGEYAIAVAIRVAS